MRKLFPVVCGMLLLAVVLGSLPSSTTASSHREAPLIAKDPTADNTDVYAFVSPDAPNTVTLIANYIPLQEPSGGPYFYNFDDNVIYAINIDWDGTGAADVTYQFRFETRVLNPNTFLYNTGPIESLDDPDWSYRQYYSITRIVQNGRPQKIADNLPVAPANIGPRSTPNYPALADAAIRTVGDNVKVFVGPRDDPFFIDTGAIFDLAGLRPFNPAHLIPLAAENGRDGLQGYNVHTIALQIPMNQLTRDGQMPSGPNDRDAVIGVYANAMRQKMRVLTSDGTEKYQGDYVQVSRLANPLVNEVIIPTGKKDYWNAQKPNRDEQFLQYYRNPELAGIVNLVYPSLPDAPTTGRDDLVAVLLTGVDLPDGAIPGVNNLNYTGPTKADLLRLNMGIPPTAAIGAGNRLGVLAADFAGFPNGRRLEDDVTDIELRAVACGYGPAVAAVLGLCNLAPNNAVGDGVDKNEKPFLTSFPYVATPYQGYEKLPTEFSMMMPAGKAAALALD